MNSERQRFDYRVVKLKPGFLGFNEQAAQETLQQLGRDGWELVSATSTAHNYFGVVLFLRRAL
ncbi:MAG TPA: DUF4177 domain-containing protein [Rhodanobacteraceae bacterium]|nr:DUF4177 domain-containing protein [Rhodanobacteraceae bacterium]